MYFVHNSWPFFDEAEADLKPIINEQGQKLISDADVKKIDKKISPKPLIDVFQYFSNINKVIIALEPFKYTYIPALLYKEFIHVSERIGAILTRIRTIRAVYNQNTLFEKLFNELTRLNTVGISHINQIYQHWLGRARKEGESDPFLLNTRVDFEYFPQIWLDLEKIKQTWYTFNMIAFPWLKVFAESGAMEEGVKNLQRINKTQNFLIDELFHAHEVEAQGGFQDPRFRLEIFYFFLQIGILNNGKSKVQADKEQAAHAKIQLEEYVLKLLHAQILANTEKYNLDYKPSSNPLKDLARSVLERLNTMQQQLTTTNEGDLNAANKDLQEKGSVLFELIDTIEQWFNDISPFLAPFSQVLRKPQNMITQTRGEIGRQLDDFDQYTQSVQEESDRTDLQQVLEEHIISLEQILESYQQEIRPLITKKIDIIPALNQIIDKYERQFIDKKAEVSRLFKDYRQQKELNLQPTFKLWEERYEEIITRSRFALKRALASVLDEFQLPLSKEDEFFKRAYEIATNQETVADSLSAEYLLPQKLSERTLRDRINQINVKIEEIERVKQLYSAEKLHFIQILEQHLKTTHNIESKKCIICHKPVVVTEDHFIQCEFCKSLSHYTCAAWWVNKYNSCPVCHNQYTIPNSQIYDPSQIEHEEEH
jgi:hypothetical protein